MDNLNHLLVVDIGNTRSKAGVFCNNELIQMIVPEHASELNDLVLKYQIKQSLYMQTGTDVLGLITVLQAVSSCIELNHKTPLPFKNAYLTPETLGPDRLAAVAAAQHYFPGSAALVFDAGTCLTADFIDMNGVYCGGAISPGLQMRLKAMNAFTMKLPLLEVAEAEKFTGNNTSTSMLSGAFFGQLAEINDRISRYQSEYGEIRVLLCGGDAALFGKHIKNPIFADPQLVLHGLNQILLFNAH